jgi:uncharacterized paraquat-inducible protein A
MSGASPKPLPKRLGALLVAATCVAFGAALSLPLFSITPGAGEWTGWIRMIHPADMATVHQTVLAGIQTLWTEGSPGLAILLSLFCLFLPIFKFSVLWGEVYGMDLQGTFWGRLCKITAPYAMVEVFVVGILVIAIKGLPGGTRIEVEPGAWCFAASVLLSLVAVQLLGRPARRE